VIRDPLDFVQPTPLPEDTELPHLPSDDPQWQESVVLGWADPSKAIGGFVRIGHQPNLGLTRSCFGVTARSGMNYARTAQDLPMSMSDRSSNAFVADGFQSATFGIRSSRWQAADSHVDLDLQVDDLHGPVDFWKLTGIRSETSRVMSANHVQAAGTFVGSLRIADEPKIPISGFTYRDHSWGPRYMENPNADMFAAWWLVGSFGPNFSIGVGGGRVRSGIDNAFGYMMKDGLFDRVVIEDASVLMAFDGVSNRGGTVSVLSKRFGRFTFEAEGYGNVVLELGKKHFEMAMPCTLRCGGQVGGGLIDTIFNPRNGVERPIYLASGALQNGLYRSRDGLNAE
jgi:hypothetical protein